ncbi:MAG: hypothetical protein COA97_02840 [Flavobacteriales bacterium]|nr:MAG: hypothetical protein COA97_02840 [Flavobacteriales bacterium]
MAELDKIEAQIFETLKPFAKKALDAELSDGDWTKGIMKLLGSLGEKNGCDISVSAISDDYDSEWLFDMTWWKYENNSLKEIPLVVESEWNRSIEEIQYDFEKIMVAKADHRLMIYQGGTKESVRETKEYLIQIIKNFKLSTIGDRYLFIGYCEEEGKFLRELFIYE